MLDSFFDNITEDKSYFLGWIISQYHTISDNKTLLVKDIIENETFIIQIKNIFDTSIKINKYYNEYSFEINSQNFIEHLLHKLHLIIDSSTVEYPIEFVRGYFEYNGVISYNNDDKNPECLIKGEYVHIINEIIKLPSILFKELLVYDSVNSVDFLGMIYKNSSGLMNQKLYYEYISFLGYKKLYDLPICKVFKSNIDAVIPSKVRESDVGYDLSIIKYHKQLNDITALYDTGIRLKVDHGYYAEIYPRSSLSKSGYMLANSVGIIDRGYTDNIYVALTKLNPGSPDIEFPFRCCQIIFRKQEHFNIIETNTDFNNTNRNIGGFGST